MKELLKGHNLTIIILYIILLMQHAWVPGFFHDGYLYAELGKNAMNGHWPIPHLNERIYSEFFHHLPFVFILEGLFFKLFGANFISARAFASLFPLATLIIFMNWTKKEKGNTLTFLAGAIFTLILPLVKKSRFPNLDLPLLLFVLLSLKFYFDAFSKKLNRSWIFCGFFFGLSLLTKGPIGLFIPLIIFIHLILTKKLELLKSIAPWCGILLGFILFSLWPILLSLNGKGYIFKQWFDFTFLHTVSDSRGTPSSPFTYIFFLLKQCGPWFLLSIYSLYFYKKKNIHDPLYLLFSTTFFSFLTLLSIPGFKYSHYIIPLYPSLAFMAAYPLQNLQNSTLVKIQNGFKGSSIILALTLLIFPLTTKIKRDPQIYKLKNFFEMTQNPPERWYIVDNVYPFWNLNNLTSWHDLGLTLQTSSHQLNGELKRNPQKNIFLMRGETWNKIKGQFPNLLFPLIKFKKGNLVAVITRDMINNEFLFNEK